MKRLLVVDDDPLVLIALKTAFSIMFPSGIKIETFSDPVDALNRQKDVAFDVVISDYRMPIMNGIEFLKASAQIHPHIVRIMLSTYSDFAVVQKAINEAEIFRYIVKPWKDADLFEHLSGALALVDTQKAERDLADQMRIQKGMLSKEEAERRKLEEEEPGLTVVEWGPNGEIIMPADALTEPGPLT